MHVFHSKDRDLDMVEMIAQGAMLKEVANKHNLSIARIQQIVVAFCSKYLKYAITQGTPETLYPGPDGEYTRHQMGPMYDNEGKWCDYSTRSHNYHRVLEKGLAYEDIPNSCPLIDPIPIDELRQYGDYWLHQIKNLRQNKKRNSK